MDPWHEYVCMYACMCVSVYVYMYVCTRMYMHVCKTVPPYKDYTL